MSQSILQSPLLNLTIINKMLASPTPISPRERVALLSARTHLLQKAEPASKVEELRSRLDLAAAHQKLLPPDLISAESELSLIESEAKRLLKRTGNERTELEAVRMAALKALMEVERELGRAGRAKRWSDLIAKLESEGGA